MHSTSVLPQLDGLKDASSDLALDPRHHRLHVRAYADVTEREFLVKIHDGRSALALDEVVRHGLRWESASTYPPAWHGKKGHPTVGIDRAAPMPMKVVKAQKTAVNFMVGDGVLVEQ